MLTITELNDPQLKSDTCSRILRALPSWFGVEQSILDYTAQVAAMPFFAACDGEEIIGFAALKRHNAYTAEVCVMGVLQGYHRQGAGRLLVEACILRSRDLGLEFLTVKTLDGSAEDAGYEKTRRFYHAIGFRPLEVFRTLWDEANPCLFLAMKL